MFIWLICVFQVDSFGQNTKGVDLEKANQYYNSANWPLAILAYESYLTEYPNHINSRIKLGKALMEMNRLDDSLHEWKTLIQSKKELPAEVYFWAARTCHQLGLYTEADDFYRNYIVLTKDEVDLELINYYLKQIGAAKTAGVAGSRFLVENSGSSVNSEMDEFHPIYSLNFDQRFYYSLAGEETENPIFSTASASASVMYAEVRQGEWVPQGPMDTDLVHDRDVQLLDFSVEGKSVLYTRPSEVGGRVTFRKRYEDVYDQSKISEWIHPVFKSRLGDRDLFIINDSAYLFSSNRLEGYGGYDIYVTFKRLGQWVVQNLGSTINSSYDEISPFLCLDGRSIYFSSNSDKSIGGYDVFFATFDDNMESWTSPSNMLPPINSGVNDVEFRISKDGSSAIFSSNRPHGYGGYDIYHAYFDQELVSQNQNNRPQYFYQVQAYRLFTSESSVSQSSSEKPVYNLPIVYFGMRPVVVTPKIKTQLDEILKYAQLFPHTGLILNVFTDQPWDTEMTLYKPVLILKNLTDYLKMHGMNPARIKLRLYGDQYPRFTSYTGTDYQMVENARSFNRRLEFEFTDTENLPVQFGDTVSLIQDDSERISPYLDLKNRTMDLYFRIQLVESKQLIKGLKYEHDGDFMLEIDDGDDRFTYYVGVFQQVEEAKRKLSQYTAKGYENAEIVAFLGTSKLAGDKITADMIELYPELKKYIIY